jgi:hypothetical protein
MNASSQKGKVRKAGPGSSPGKLLTSSATVVLVAPGGRVRIISKISGTAISRIGAANARNVALRP